MSTTQFSEWFSNFDASNIDDVDALYEAVYSKGNAGLFTVEKTTNGNGIVVKSSDNEDLAIVSEKARLEFLRELEDRYCEGMIEPAWYNLYNEMRKND